MPLPQITNYTNNPFLMNLLNGKIALITGGSRGIGEALVRNFVAQGAKVAFTYVSAGSQARAEKLANEFLPAIAVGEGGASFLPAIAAGEGGVSLR